MNLKELRIKNRYSQAQLAKELGILQTRLCKYEKGLLEMNYELLQKTADFFSISVDELLGRNTNSSVINLKLLTPIQQRLINAIINSDNEICQKFEAFFTGYFSGREQQLQDLTNLNKGGKNELKRIAIKK